MLLAMGLPNNQNPFVPPHILSFVVKTYLESLLCMVVYTAALRQIDTLPEDALLDLLDLESYMFPEVDNLLAKGDIRHSSNLETLASLQLSVLRSRLAEVPYDSDESAERVFRGIFCTNASKRQHLPS